MFKGHTNYVHGVAFSADGRRLASAARDQTLRLWDLTTGQEALSLELHPTVFPSPSPSTPTGGKWHV